MWQGECCRNFSHQLDIACLSGHTRLPVHLLHEAALFLLLFNGWFKINWGRNYLIFQVFLFQYFGFIYGDINFATLLLSRDKLLSLKKKSLFFSLSVMHNWEAFLGKKWLEALWQEHPHSSSSCGSKGTWWIVWQEARELQVLYTNNPQSRTPDIQAPETTSANKPT